MERSCRGGSYKECKFSIYLESKSRGDYLESKSRGDYLESKSRGDYLDTTGNIVFVEYSHAHLKCLSYSELA